MFMLFMFNVTVIFTVMIRCIVSGIARGMIRVSVSVSYVYG